MIPTELKIIITCVLFWFITHLFAFPGSLFADWGKKKFNSYRNFITIILVLFTLPAFITGLYWLWSI